MDLCRAIMVSVMLERPISIDRSCTVQFIVERRRGGEPNGADFNVPEYLLPNQEDVLLTPLFATTSRIKVTGIPGYPIFSHRGHGCQHSLSVQTAKVLGTYLILDSSEVLSVCQWKFLGLHRRRSDPYSERGTVTSIVSFS